MARDSEITYKGFNPDGSVNNRLVATRKELEETYENLARQIQAAETGNDGIGYARATYTLTQLMYAEAFSGEGNSDAANTQEEWALETGKTIRELGVEPVLNRLAAGKTITYQSDTINAKGDKHPNQVHWNADYASDSAGRTTAQFINNRGRGYVIATTVSGGPRDQNHTPTRVVTAIRGMGSSRNIEIPR